MNLPKPVSTIIEYFESLPGIGTKTAERLTFYLLNTPVEYKKAFSKALGELSEKVFFCKNCFNISDSEVCSICKDSSRNQKMLCVVEEALDLIAMEKSGYKGLYHCLGGALSPLNNIGPEELRIDELVKRVWEGEFEEVILATNPSLEGEATAMYIKSKLKTQSAKGKGEIKMTRLGRGLPVGADVEYADSQTLARSLEGRQEY